ncbi:aminotransferase [Rhodovibrionaceae bacterium A322]
MAAETLTQAPLATEGGNDHLELAARRHLIQPWEAMGSLGQDVRTFIGQAQGIYVKDREGRPLIDGPAGMWCVQVGHGRPEIGEAMAKQCMDLAYNSPWNSTSSPVALLAERLAQHTPGDLNHIFFTCGGSTAVDSALRFVQFFNNVLGRPEKKLILARNKGYHGSTYLSASCSGKDRDKNFFDFTTELVTHLSCPDPFRRPEGMSVEAFCDSLIEEMEAKILELGPEKVAVFIAEPILASGGVIVPPKGYHRRTWELCQKYDILYISDEVVTAFGRLGHWFASEEVFGITPDIITFAKGLTSGYVPMGGMALSDKMLKRLDGQAATYSNGYTYSGHPVSCVAAQANMDLFEQDNLLAHVRDISPYFQAKLKELEELPIVGEVRGEGLMACVECVTDSGDMDALTMDYEVGNRIDHHCQEMGLMVRPIINMCVMSPPLVITREEIDQMVAILKRGIEATMADLEAEGLWSAKS